MLCQKYHLRSSILRLLVAAELVAELTGRDIMVDRFAGLFSR